MTKENHEGKNTYLVMFNRTVDSVNAYTITNKDVYIDTSYKDDSHIIGVIRAYNKLDAIALMKKEHGRLMGY